MQHNYAHIPKIIQYLDQTWIAYAPKFVIAYTKDNLHLGSHATSCVEGTHAFVKQYLQILMGNLQTAKEKISLGVTDQIVKFHSEQANNALCIHHHLNCDFFKLLVKKVATYALNLVFEELKKA